jgi:hypothetical protein
MASLVVARTRKDGWTYNYDEGGYVSSEMPEHSAIPAVSPDEMVRARRNSVNIQKRFHYRYGAADLAWEAGKSLPANHPLLARLYTTAGYWLAPSDPKAADRLYQALVRRCSGTAEGKAADEKRWFPSSLRELESMEALPPGLRRDPKAEPPW